MKVILVSVTVMYCHGTLMVHIVLEDSNTLTFAAILPVTLLGEPL